MFQIENSMQEGICPGWKLMEDNMERSKLHAISLSLSTEGNFCPTPVINNP